MKPYIVFVDPDPDRLYFFRKACELSTLPCRVETVLTPEELFALLDSLNTPPRLVLLDHQLPGADALNTLKQIRNHPRYRRIPVVLLVEFSDPVTIERAYFGGANSVIFKPASNLETIQRLVEGVGTYWLIHNRTLKHYE